MLKLVNAVMVCAVLVSAFFLYRLEYANRSLERAIAKTERQTQEEQERIKLLQAEWASLTRPERLQKIAEEQLHFKVLKAQQYVPLADIAQALAGQPETKSAQNKDAIGALLEKMQ